MTEIKVPVFESYLELQKTATEEGHHLNSIVAPQLRARNILPSLEILADASEHPELYKLLDNSRNPLKPYPITSRKYMVYNGSVSLDKKVFETWYHTSHPDGIQRAKFFRGLGEEQKKLLKYYED